MCKQKLEFGADSKKTCQTFFYKYKKGWWWGEPKHMPIFFKKRGKKTKHMLEIF
jgi:hypothetical protein